MQSIEDDCQDCSKARWYRQESDASERSRGSSLSTSASIEELSSPEFLSRQCTEIDIIASRAIDEVPLGEAIKAKVAECVFCATIADSRPDFPLIVVSERFETMTGYRRDEMLGKNCRFLNDGLFMPTKDLVGIREACRTGSPFTTVVTNRRKSGELFLNLLSLRGLSVAHNPASNEDLWFLVGLQADVTDILTQEVADNLMPELQQVANSAQEMMVHELSNMAIAGALAIGFQAGRNLQALKFNRDSSWRLLAEPRWMETSSTPSAFSAAAVQAASQEAMLSAAQLPAGGNGLPTGRDGFGAVADRGSRDEQLGDGQPEHKAAPLLQTLGAEKMEKPPCILLPPLSAMHPLTDGMKNSFPCRFYAMAVAAGTIGAAGAIAFCRFRSRPTL